MSMSYQSEAIENAAQTERRGGPSADFCKRTGYDRTGDLAKKLNVTKRALRIYSNMGILNPLREGGQRYFDQANYDRLITTLTAQHLGLSLQDLANMFKANAALTLRDIVAQLPTCQLLAQRDDLVRQRERMDFAMAEILSVLEHRDDPHCPRTLSA